MAFNKLLLLALSTGLQGAVAEKLIASHFSGDIYTLSLSDNGTLSIVGSVSSGAEMPTWLAYDAKTGDLVVPDESWSGAGVMSQFSVSKSGTVTPVASAATLGGDVHGTFYHTADGGTFVATANYDGASISTYPYPLSSTTEVQQTLVFEMEAPGPDPDRQNAPHPHAVFPSPDGQYLLTPDLGADRVRIFRIDSPSGELTNCADLVAAPGDGPRHGEFGTFGDLEVLYVVNELSQSVSVWAPEGSSDDCLSLVHLQTLSTYAPGTEPPAGVKAAEVHVIDNFVYVSNRNDQSFGPERDSLAVYEVDPETGLLTFLELADAHGYFPRTFSINAKGDKIAIGGQTTSNVAILARNTTNGLIEGLIASVEVATDGTVNSEDGLSAVVWV